ncbi:hypothetical protein BDZ94DRAFT_1170650, partial [Collybia nuda]
GIIYFSNEHFTCRIIQADGTIWFHDGITTGPLLIHYGCLTDTTNLSSCRSKYAVSAFYDHA